VARVLGYRSGGPDSIPGTTRKKSSGSATGSTQPREHKWGATWYKSSSSCLENREYGRRDSSRWPRSTLYPQNVSDHFADKRRSLGRYSSLADSDHPILFATCTGTFSKLCKHMYTMACRRVLQMEIELTKLGFGGWGDCMYLSRYRDQWRVIVSSVMNRQVQSSNSYELLVSCAQLAVPLIRLVIWRWISIYKFRTVQLHSHVKAIWINAGYRAYGRSVIGELQVPHNCLMKAPCSNLGSSNGHSKVFRCFSYFLLAKETKALETGQDALVLWLMFCDWYSIAIYQTYITHRYIQCTLYLNDMHSGTIWIICLCYSGQSSWL
jgi:hypothetical protein